MNSTNPMLPDTRIFSPLAVPGLCVTIGRYWHLFKRLTALSAGRFYRFEHIVTYSSGKVVAKWDAPVPEFLKRGGRRISQDFFDGEFSLIPGAHLTTSVDWTLKFCRRFGQHQ